MSKSQPGSVSIWFLKLICTLYVRPNTSLKKTLFLRNNLNPDTAFHVIRYMGSNLKHPNLAFAFLEYSRNVCNVVHGIESYEFVLRSLCHVGGLELAKLVLDLVRRDGLLFFLDKSVFGFVIMSFVNAGKFEVAKELVIDYTKTSVGNDGLGVGVVSCLVINRFLSSLVKSDRVDEAVSLFENVVLRSRCCLLDTYSFNIVISGLCRAREVDKAFGIFNKMRNFGCLPDSVTYNTLMNGCCRVGKVDKAHELLREVCRVDGCSPNVVAFTSVISGYCKLGKMEEALVLFDKMVSYGTRPNTITFNAIIDGYGKIGDMGSVLNMYEKMLNLGCTPDVITFTSILDGHCRVGELHQGIKIWDEMNRRNLYPNIYTFSVLINSLCKETRFSEARDLLRQLRKRCDIVAKAFIYNPVIDGFCKAGKVDEANVIFREMEEKRCKPDKLTFTILIIGHCAKGRMVEAISLFNKMLIAGCAPDLVTVNSLASRLLKAGMPKEAFEIRKASLGMPVTRRDASYSKNVDIPVAV